MSEYCSGLEMFLGMMGIPKRAVVPVNSSATKSQSTTSLKHASD